MKKLILFSAAMLFAAVTFAQTTDGSASTAPGKIAINVNNITQPDNSKAKKLAAEIKIVDEKIKAIERGAKKIGADIKADHTDAKMDLATLKMDEKGDNKAKEKQDLRAYKIAVKDLNGDKRALKKDKRELKADRISLKNDIKKLKHHGK